MTNPPEFTAEMIKGNNITRTEKAEIKIGESKITIHRFKKEPCDIWISTPKTYNRVFENLTELQAIEKANQLLKTI